jgi:hypothetical protein
MVRCGDRSPVWTDFFDEEEGCHFENGFAVCRGEPQEGLGLTTFLHFLERLRYDKSASVGLIVDYRIEMLEVVKSDRTASRCCPRVIGMVEVELKYCRGRAMNTGGIFVEDEAATSNIRILLTRAHVSLSVISAQRVHAKQSAIQPPSRHRHLRDVASLRQLGSPRPCPSQEDKYEYAYPSRKTWSRTRERFRALLLDTPSLPQRSHQYACPYRCCNFPRTKQLVVQRFGP